MKIEEKTKRMQSFIEKYNKQLQKKYGANVLYMAREVEDYEPFRTHFPTFDWMNSGIGGFPRGGITLVHGPESCGKSTFTVEAIANEFSYNPEAIGLYVDVENTMTKQYFKSKKIDVDRLALTPMNAAEDVLSMVKNAIREDIYDIIVIDSLAKIDSQVIIDGDVGEKAQRNRRAVLLTEFFKHISLMLRKSKTALVCINQEVINQDPSPWAPRKILPGGEQQRYSANLRIEVKRAKALKDGDKHIGYRTRFTTLKSKISTSERVISEMIYLLDRGFMRDFSLLEYLLKINYIKALPQKRYEFIDKNLYPEKFKPSNMNKIVNYVLETHGINLFDLEPDDQIKFDKDESYDEDKNLGTDEIETPAEEEETAEDDE